MDLLLKRGAKVDMLDGSGFAALHAACHRDVNNLDVAQLLLAAGASVNLMSRDGQTPLFVACTPKRNYDTFLPSNLVSLLLQFGAEVNVECVSGRNQRMTPLAAILARKIPMERKMELVKLVVSHIRSESNFDFLTALRATAAGTDNPEITRLFLDHVASPNAPKGETSPLHMACQRGHHRVAEMLLNAGADVHAVCQEGQSSLTWAVRGYVEDEEDFLLTVNLLVSRGADINQRDGQGRTPLHWAIDSDIWNYNRQRILRILQQKGADPNLPDVLGRTPLLTVCQDRYIRDAMAANIAYTLLKEDAEAEVTGEDGQTPLLLAVRRDHNITMEELFLHQMDGLPDYE